MRRRAEPVTSEKVEQVEGELLQAEAALAERERAHEQLLAEVAADVALGALSAGDAGERTRPSEEALDLAREHVEQLRRALPALRLRLEQQEAEQAERERVAAAKTLASACESANATATRLAKILADADSAARDLLARRTAVDLAAEKAGAGLGDDVSSQSETRRRNPALGPGTGRPDGWQDEPGWDTGVETLRQVLADGPPRPLASAEAHAQAKAREVEGQEREIRNWLRVDPVRRARLLVAQKDGVADSVRREADEILAGVTVGRPGQETSGRGVTSRRSAPDDDS